MKPLQVLFISSRPPQHSAGLADDMMNALTAAGHQVDFLTRFDFEGRKNNQFYVFKKPSKVRLLFDWFLRLPDIVRYGKKGMYSKIVNNGMMITNLHEDKPRMSASRVVASIKKQYDVVVTLFWQDMLTTYTLKAIYEKLHCPIIIRSVDMFTYTGGCFYFADCKNYEKGCGCCPILNSSNPNDQTHKNFLIKKKMYDSIDYAIGLNTWMKRFASKTGLFEDWRIVKTCAIIDEDKFKPLDIIKARERFGISGHDKFVLFARYSAFADGKRKGFDYLVDALDQFYDMLTREERQSVVLLFAGSDLAEEKQRLKFEAIDAGFLSAGDLILAYNAATAFLNPVIDDAGPSMVNQSIMCGTPVISFNVGTAIDVIDKGISGYRVETKNTKDYALAIYDLFNMSIEEKKRLRHSCRERGLETSSKQSFARMVENSYELLTQRRVK